MNPRETWLPFLVLFVIGGIQADDYRLSTLVTPISYSLTFRLEPDFGETAVFQGEAVILLEVQQATNTFEIHGYGFTIISSTLTATSATANLISSVGYNETVAKYTIVTTGNLAITSNYTLTVSYNGTLYDDMYGFYRSWYEAEDGSTVWLATTQFQPTYARRAFPCFDEPSFKAYFDISIERPTNYRSLTNAPLASRQSLSNGLVKDIFETTPKMSTYLVAMVVSDYASISDDINKDAVWSRREAIGAGDYGFQLAPKLISAFDNFTNIEFLSAGTGKLDQVAIPDFGAGAMENWGLITYREYGILWDPEESTNSNKQYVATVIAHELAHMWFGNLVTCSWWSYTWLNEGFAQYFMYIIASEIESGMELDKQLVVNLLQGIFATDSTTSSASLNSDASTPSEVSYKFASTSYYKGASIIRMMRDFLGAENFRSALQLYLSTYSYQSTVPENLWSSLQQYANNSNLPANVSTVMSTWTNQAGFPVVTVTLSGTSNIVLTQQRFLLNNTLSSDLQYYVPISYTNSAVRDFDTVAPSYWLLPNSSLTISNAVVSSGWVVVNIQETGYYRVNYDTTLWSRIITALKSSDYSGIHVLNRAQLLDDSLNLARAGLLPYSTALDLASYLSSETEYYPWYSALEAFSYLRIRSATSSTLRSYLENYIQDLFSSLYSSLSFDYDPNESHVDILKKVKILDLACELEIQSCVTKANALFNEFRSNNVEVTPNMRSVVYCTALRTANSSDNWYFLWNRFLTTKLATESNIILSALGCTRNDTLRNEYMTKTITEGSGIRSQDSRTAFQSIYTKNLDGVEAAFDFFRANLQAITSYYGGSTSLGTILSGIAARLSSTEQVNNLEAFIEEYQEDLGGALTTARSALESARANVAWMEQHTTEITNWFASYYGSTSSGSVNSLNSLLFLLVVTYVFIKFY